MTKTQTSAPEDDHGPPELADYHALEIDYELYMKMLEDSEWNDEQKREFIETIWSIVVSFVDLGFGVHPVQQALDDVDISKEVLKSVAREVLDSEEGPKNCFANVADGKPSPSTERETS